MLITIDTLRRDRVGAYGAEAGISPNLDRLASGGVRFDDALAQAISTPASHASILTGLNPPAHGLRRLWGERLSGENVTLAEILRAAGFTTAAFVSALPLREELGLAQGFAHYDASLAEGRSERGARETNERLRAWLPTRPMGRAFLWIHYFDPHAPYYAPKSARARFGVAGVARRHVRPSLNLNPDTGAAAGSPPARIAEMSGLYDAEVHHTDAALGELLSLLREDGMLEDAIVAVVADHGECLGERGYYFGHWDVYDETARIPMLLRHPRGRWAGRVVEAPVGTIDLLPTLLAWLDVDWGQEVDGIDLTPLIEGAVAPERSIYTEQIEYFPAYAVRSGRWQLIERPDVASGRRTSLVPRRPGDALPDDPEERERVMARLREQMLRPSSGPRRAPEPIELSDEVKDGLRALGYAH